MTLLRLLPLVVAPMLPLATLPAQLDDFQMQQHTIPAPTGSMSLAVSGKLTGSGYADAAQVIGGLPYLFACPGLGGELSLLPGTWSGVTGMVARNSGAPVDRQQLLITDQYGLRLFYFDPMIGKTTIPLPIAGWNNAYSLCSFDLNGDGAEDLIGIQAGGTQLRVTWGLGVGAGETEMLELPGVAQRCAAVQWGQSRCVFVAVGSSLFQVLEDLGEVTEVTVSQHSSTVALLPVRTDVGWGLVWCTSGPAGNSFHWLTPGSEENFTFSGHDLIAGAAGDIDADGDDDIVFSKRDEHAALLFLHDSGESSYENAQRILLPGSGVPPVNEVVPLLIDVDGDRDADLVHGVQSQSVIVLGRALDNDPGETCPRLLDGLHLGETEYDRVLTFTLDTMNVPVDATDIEIIVWRVFKNGEGQYQVVEPVQSWRLDSPNEPFAQIQMAGFDRTGFYLLWMRGVRIDSGVVVDAYAPAAGIFTGNQSGWDQIEVDFPTPPADYVLFHDELDGGERAGGYIEILLPPPISPGPIPAQSSGQ